MSTQYLDGKTDDYKAEVSNVVNTLKEWSMDNTKPYIKPEDQHIVDDLIKWHYIGPMKEVNGRKTHFIAWHSNRYYPDRTIDDLFAKDQTSRHSIDDVYSLIEAISSKLDTVLQTFATN